MQADGVRDTALVVLRRDHPDLARELGCGPLETPRGPGASMPSSLVIRMRSSIMRLLTCCEE